MFAFLFRNETIGLCSYQSASLLTANQSINEHQLSSRMNESVICFMQFFRSATNNIAE